MLDKKTIINKFRDKFGRFYYSDKNGIDWEKPKTQNVTGRSPEGHNGYCIASDDIEELFIKTILQILDDVAGEEETFEDFENDKLHPVAVFKKGREEKRQEILTYKDKFK